MENEVSHGGTAPPRKSVLREAVRFVYAARGPAVAEVRRRGIIPGSLLAVGDELVAVRAAPDREFSLTRLRDGSIATIRKVQQVAVAAPCVSDPSAIEVFGFSPALIMAEFERAVAAQRALYPKVTKGPVFVALDVIQDDGTPLTGKALWRNVVPIDRVPRQARTHTLQVFRRKVHRDFAELVGLPEEEVEVEFRIVSRGGKRNPQRRS